MAEPTIEKTLCEECGVETRENAQYCFNCGAHVSDISNIDESPESAALDVESQAALDDLSAKLDGDNDDNKIKFAKAAVERKLKRVSHRQPKEFVWEAADDSVGLRVLAVAIVVAFVAIVIVYLTVYWR